MRRPRRGLAAAAATAACAALLLTGCWDQEPIEQMGFVSVVAFDGGRAGITAYTQATIPTALKSAAGGPGGGGGGGGGGGAAYELTVGHGQDAASAVRDAQRRTARRLSFDQIEVVLLTDRVAQDGGTLGLLDYFERGAKTRIVPWLYIVHHQDLPAVLAAQPRGIDYPGEAIVYQSLKAHALMAADTGRLYDIFDRIVAPGRDAAAPVLGVQAGQFAIGPTAVFRRADMVGELDRESSDALPLLVGWRHGQTALDAPCGRGGRAAVEIRSPRLAVGVEVAHGWVHALDVGMTAAVAIDEVTDCPGSLGMGHLEDQIVHAAAGGLYARLAHAIGQLQALDSDVIGFGAYLRAHDPAVWRAVEPTWYQIYPHLPVRLTVTLHPGSTGLLHMGEPAE